MHLDDERVQRLIHHELPPEDAGAVREHLERCPACRDLVAAAERADAEIGALLVHLDHDVPRVSAARVAHIAGHTHAVRLRWAAGIVLTLAAAGAVYAVPGSPLRTWLSRQVESMDPPPDPPVVAPAAESAGGIDVEPGRELAIRFISPPAGAHARVTLTDEAAVTVRALDGSATFTSDPDVLRITDADAARLFEIRIPRTAPRVDIAVDDSRLLRVEAGRVTTFVSPDESGAYRLPLVRPSR